MYKLIDKYILFIEIIPKYLLYFHLTIFFYILYDVLKLEFSLIPKNI